ncbi:MAG: hypothetical protein PHH43_00475 [Candidatus Cloacimonetes bacterium]|jgi:putative solute:sodium symporter small subunit|nr:hypothetical protein [Candidatus Cloacimonadota bacterium]MDD3234785.1 hypothetical protein [Candidatus Cloacimonadota bacterium]
MYQIILSTLFNVKYSFWIMAQGMLGIFIFMALFYLLIYALERLFKAK